MVLNTGDETGAGPVVSAREVRGKLFADHVHLGELLKRAGRLAYRVLDGESAAAGPLREAIVALADPLAAHVDFEDLFLPSVIGHAPWGPIHLLHAKVNHAHQHDCMTALLDRAEHRPGDDQTLAEEALALVRELVQDIAREEHDLVHPDALGAETAPPG